MSAAPDATASLISWPTALSSLNFDIHTLRRSTPMGSSPGDPTTSHNGRWHRRSKDMVKNHVLLAEILILLVGKSQPMRSNAGQEFRNNIRSRFQSIEWADSPSFISQFANTCTGPSLNRIGSGRIRQKVLEIDTPSGQGATKRPSSNSVST